MSTEQHNITVSGLPVEMVRKEYKEPSPRGISTRRVVFELPRRSGSATKRSAWRSSANSVGSNGSRRSLTASHANRRGRWSAVRATIFSDTATAFGCVNSEGPVGIVIRNKSTIELHVRSGRECRNSPKSDDELVSRAV